MQCVLNCTVSYAKEWEENHTTNTSVTIYRNPYKQVMNIMLPYYGYTSAIVSNNKPDIIIRDNKQRTCMSTDVAISADRNVIKKEAENNLKYKDIIIEIQLIWNVKAKVISIITGET